MNSLQIKIKTLSDYQKYSRPELARILKKLHLDYEVLSGSGSYLTVITAGGNQKKVLDLVMGYGSCLLGHNHPVLVETLINALQNNTVINAQLSLREKAGGVARVLNSNGKKETGKNFITLFVNSGAEAVEAAMKHGLMAYYVKIQKFIAASEKIFNIYESRNHSTSIRKDWREKVELNLKNNPAVFLALEGAFHGKTLGALSLTYNENYRRIFTQSLAKCKFINASDICRESIKNEFVFTLPFPEITATGILQIKEKEWLPFAAFFAEPIQGEAGVVMLSPNQAQNLRKVCDTFNIPLVWDEIQTGCYRTGSLFASSELNATGDYYLLGKALGGGLTKVSALMIEENSYLQKFGVIHTSTFAEDELSSIVAFSFLETAEKLSETIRDEGEKWKDMLLDVKKQFPNVVKEVRGKGLIWGMEFNDFNYSGCYGLQSLSRGGYFNYLLAAWMFQYHNIRFSAPLSNGHTLRLHPPVGCTEEDILKVRKGLEQLCHLLDCEDLYALIAFLLPEKWQTIRPYPQHFSHGTVYMEIPEKTIPAAGFITHYIDEKTLEKTDPSLSCLPVAIIENLLEEFQEMMSPVITGSRTIETLTGEKIHLTLSGLPFTAAMAKRAMAEKNSAALKETIIKGVKLLEHETSAAVIGLGQYTSIITNNGLSVSASDAELTTGNGYAAFLAAEALLNECTNNEVDPTGETLAVFGAGGNIGSVISTLLLPYVKEVLLFGNPSGKNIQLKKLTEELSALYPTKKISITENISEAKNCRLLVAVTSHPEPFLNNENLHPRAVVCDVSVPLNVCPELFEHPGNRIIIQGGVASLPDGKPVPSRGFPLPEGKMYACLAETLMLGLEKRYDLASKGSLLIDKVKQLGCLGIKYGFNTTSVKEEAVG
jgi:acetylornithine/succinyldiaminopimelate/putrescine aminotransferase/predicted amino acid dehydrogenase